jgi:phosphate transport system substrate-binding protein
VLVVVPDQVWNSGVRMLTPDQLRGIHEGRIKNWREVGGEDRQIVFYNRDISGSVWELVMGFLYEDTRRAPMSQAEILSEQSDVATSVEFNAGSVSLLEFGAFKGGHLHALSLKMPDGSIVEPTMENIVKGRYPLARPLMIVTGRKPTGMVREFVEFMLAPEGQEFVKRTGHIANAEVEAARTGPRR